MVEIYLRGPRESGWLDMDPNTILHLESDSDIFDEDLTLGTFSLPVDIPWTEHNRRLLNYAERLKNNDTSDNFYKVSIFDSGFPEVPSGKLTIIGKNGNFAGISGKFSATISGAKGLFGTLIKNKKMTDLKLGGKITWDGIDSRQFATALMQGSYPGYQYIKFAPVAIENFFDSSRKDYNGEFLALDTVNTVVQTGAGPDSWVFARPATNGSPSISGTAEYADYRTVPFFKLTFLLRQVFEEFGYSVSGEIFESSQYNDLFCFNNYGIEYYSPGYVDYNRSITPSNHVPAIAIIDWLKGIFSFFSIYPVFEGNNAVRLHFRKSLTSEKRVTSLNGAVQEIYSSTREEEEKGGYTLQYNWGNDDYAGDRVHELTDKTLIARVQTIGGLDSINIGRELTTDDIVYVVAENMYYQVADATTSPVKWDVYAEGLESYKSGDGDRSVDLNMSTLCTYVEEDKDTGLMVRRNYVGCRLAGSYLNSKGLPVVSEFSNKVFFIRRLTNTSGVSVPVSFNHNRNAQNEQVSSFSLALTAPDGLAETFHNNWQSRRSNETVKVAMRTNRRLMQSINDSNIFEINGIHFLMKKMEPVIPQNDLMNAELTVL